MPLAPFTSRRPRQAWRALLGAALGAGLAAGLGAQPGAGEEPPFPAPAPVPLATVLTGAESSAGVLLQEAEGLLARGAFPAARELLGRALASEPDALVLAPPRSDPERALRWPVRRVVEEQAGRLPPEERARLEAAHASAREGALAALAAGGDQGALTRLAQAPALSERALEALRAAAERDLEHGASSSAAVLFGRWLAARPAAPAAERAPVLLRLADALHAAGDMGGLRALLAASEPAFEGPVEAGGAVLTPRARIEGWMLALQRGGEAARPDEPAPPDLEGLWRADLSDPGLRGAAPVEGVVAPGAAGDEGRLVVNDGRRVHALDPLTGRLRWRFPMGPQGWEHAPEARFTAHDVPLRSVDLVGDVVLAVLGDPPASGTFEHGGLDVDAEGLVRESRARLVALDAATGGLRWATGLADERHPVLGDRRCAVSSPALVVGDRVYVLFGRRFGVAEHFAACLELATGRPRWVVPLASSESGRGPGPRVMRGREDRAPVTAVPWSARPALDGGELCVTPHAGFAAGLSPHDGRVRWLRALPRYDPDPQEGALAPGYGASARNAPVPVRGAWVLAPMDAPVLLGLEQGTGRLRWRSLAPPPGRAPPWRDLLGAAPDAEGRLRVRLVGLAPGELDPSDGALVGLGGPFDVPGAGWPGRALDLGGLCARASEGRLLLLPWPGRSRDEVPAVALAGPLPRVQGGDLLRAGAVWVVVEPRAVSAWLPRAEADRLLAARAAEASASAAERAAGALVGARRARDAAALAQAALHGPEDAGPPDRGLATVRAEALAALLGDPGIDAAGLAALAPAIQALTGAPRAGLLLRLAERHLAEGRRSEALEVLAAAVDAPPVPVPVQLAAAFEADDPDGAPAPPLVVTLRSDLAAGRLVADLRRSTPPGVLAAYDARRAAEVDAARDAGPAALSEALRRALGTPAAARAREALRALALAAQDPGRAAALAADLRLDPPTGLDGAQGLAWAARWQLAEAEHLVAAGDPGAARRLLTELARWVPSGTRGASGRTAHELQADLRGAYGFALPSAALPTRRLDVWAGGPAPQGREEIQAIAFLGVEGPGAVRLEDRLLVSRGMTLEIWDVRSGRRVASLPADDEGWFGGGLQDVTPWLPERGVRVVSLAAGEPADRSGVHPGDWITSWDGAPLHGLADFMGRIVRTAPGAEVAVDVRRAGERVLSRLTPGRRPVGDGIGVLQRTRLHAAADGRVLVPSRTGLAWVDVHDAVRTPLWRWDGTGTVQRVDVAAGRAYVLVRRQQDADALVAVALADGREAWRVDVDGMVMGLRATGSVVALEVEDPPRALLLDRDDGSLRASVPLAPRRQSLDDITRVRASACAADAAGRVFVLRPDAGYRRVALDLVNGTTAAVTPAVRDDLGGEPDPQLPAVAADALVALPLSGGRIDVLLADPLAGGAHQRAHVGEGDLFTEERHHGLRLDAQSRVLVQGDTLYVLRNRADLGAGANVRVFGLDPARVPPRMAFRDFSRVILPSAEDLRILALDLAGDGLLVAAAALPDRRATGTRRAVLWVPSAELGSAERDSGHAVWEEAVQVPWRGGAVRSGRWLVLPTDLGAALVPLASAPGR